MRFEAPSHPAPEQKPALHSPKHKRRLFKLPKMRTQSKSTAVIIASCAVIIVALAGLSGYLYWQNNHLKDQQGSGNASVNSQSQADAIIKKVSKLYAFPNNEKPTVATVKDVSQLKGQTFFKSAQNGDALLVFTNAKIALLYRQSENRIINIGPVSVSPNDQSSTSQNATSSTTSTKPTNP